MLSGIKLVSKEDAERLEAEDHRKHKKDKHKKHKKEKRKKEKRDKKHYSSSDDSDSEPQRRGRSASPAKGDHGDGAGDKPTDVPSVQREDWMTVPMGRPLAATKPEEEKKEPESDPDRPKVSSKELNPYLRGTSSGGDEEAAAEQPSGAAPGIGDGGASWRMKALRRAQAQAGEEARGLGDVVAERWGSLGDLTQELAERKAADEMAHARAARERRFQSREGADRGGGGGRYLSDVKSAKSQMRRPSEVDLEKMSWRRDRGGSRGGSESEGAGRDRERGGEERQRPPRPPSRGLGQKPSSADILLKSAAPELNAFSNDGSFMDQFAAKQQQSHGGGPKADKEAPLPPQTIEAAAQHADEEDALHYKPSSPRHHKHHHRSRGGYVDEEQELPKKANLSAAAALRARLSGKPIPGPSRNAPQEEIVALPLIDAQGRAAPGALGREAAGAAVAGVRPTKRVERYEGGERKRYFADDDAVDLDTLVKRTKYGDTGDIDAAMIRNITKRTNFKESDLDADAEYDYDVGVELADNQRKASKDARRRGNAAAEAAQKEKQRQIREYNKFQSALDRCNLCFTSKSRQKHLTLAIGTAAYLALPPRGRLVPGHCQIIPVEHVASTRIADEATWTEIRNFKKCLLQMFASQGMDCIFIETAARSAGDVRAHAIVDCVPVPQDVFSKAPMYFRKAVDDATSEWSQHAAKRMIDTTSKGLKGSIPPNFPYFFVEFGLGAGFVHVIDNPEEFDRELGRSVLIGLLGLPEEDMHRRAKRESETLQSQWAAEFRSQFDEFDWTKQL